jgi:NAD-dependent SIR2 family protein deacetylase
MDSIRKTIFKDELRFIQLKHNLSGPEIDQIIHSIFENPLTLAKQYMLKREINTLEDLSSELNKVSTNKEVIGAINTLFLVQDDLELPVDLKNLFLKNEKICVFVGAGISKLLGLPLWRKLADSAIEYLHRTNKINYFEYQRIINDVIDPKQKLTIFHNLLPKNTKEAKEFYDSAFKTNYDIGNPYDLLVEFDWVKVTTNIDNEFYNALNKKLEQFLKVKSKFSHKLKIMPKPAKKEFNNFDVNKLNNETIYHIHGSIDNLEQTILTTKDYIEEYYGDSGRLKTFLRDLFNEYAVIFIGYGLEEFPILEHVIKNSKNHYAVMGTYQNEMNLFRLNSEYFKTLNITPIPFYLDFNGYDRLMNMLDLWIQNIRDSRAKDYYQKIKDIDELVD